MPKIEPFEEHTERYESWFDDHPHVFESELRALRKHDKNTQPGLEIGVGSGQFAAPLGFQYGIDPSQSMLNYAHQRGVTVARAIAESLPFVGSVFPQALIVTTICFVDDVEQTFREAKRVLTDGGRLLIGFIDRDSPMGHYYQEHKDQNPFYRDAIFHSTGELVNKLEGVGFGTFSFSQTIFRPLGEIEQPEPIRDGYGDGSFVVIQAS